MSTTLTTDTLSSVWHDTFVTAVEGGIQYWAHVVEYDWDRPDWYAVVIPHEEAHDPEAILNITEPTIRLGFQRLSAVGANTPSPFQRIRDAAMCLAVTDGRVTGPWDEIHDADTADMVVQYGVLGSLVYG